MSHRFGFVVLAALAVLPLRAADPETLLPATSQFYIHWDGIAKHQAAYDQSARGQMMSGDTSRALLTLRRFLLERLHDSLTGDALSQGQPPDKLIQINSDCQQIGGLLPLLAEHGIIFAGEIRDPTKLTYESLFQKVGGAIRNGNATELVKPEVHVYAIVPGAAQKAAPMLAGLRLIATTDTNTTMKTSTMLGRSVTVIAPKGNDVQLATWAEGNHLVVYAGTSFSDGILRKMQSSGPNLTSHRLYKQAASRREFAPITRGFFDGAALFGTVQKMMSVLDPKSAAWFEAYGLTSIGSATFQFGFDGQASRSILEFECPKNPFGFAGAITRTPLELKDLPPLPADAVRWLGCRMDLASVYDGILSIAAVGGVDRGGDATLQAKRDEAARDVELAIGLDLKRDLFAALGDKVVTYSSPSENAFMMVSTGQVIAVSVKDADKLWATLNQLEKRMESVAGTKMRLRTRKYHGVEIREHIFQGGSFICPSYAVCDGWLVASFYSQPIQGFILRSQGKLPAWKPDERTAATLAKRPADAVGLVYSDPRVSLKQLITVAPIIAGVFSEESRQSVERAFDSGSIPNAEEATRPLFPNVTWFRNDGRSFRIDGHDSFGLPLEFLGPDLFVPFAIGGIGIF